MTGILIQLAIAEKQPDEVLKWYDYAGRKKSGLGLSDFLVDATEVAEAIKSAHPERAIAIWKETAEEQYRPSADKWVRGSSSLFAKNEKCAHAGWSQAGMGRVPSCLARRKQPPTAVFGGTGPVARWTSAGYRHQIKEPSRAGSVVRQGANMNQKSNLPILLTGATGYIGGRLLRVLENAGHRVRCITRRPGRSNIALGQRRK